MLSVNHVGDDLTAGIKYGGKIGLDHAGPLLVGHVLKKAHVGDAGVIDQDIGSSKFLLYLSNKMTDE